MTHNRSQTGHPRPAELPTCQTLLENTDWASLATACGTGESLPAALTRLTAPDPAARQSALRDVLGAVTHQNSIYEATVPVALYVAAILDHPVLVAGSSLVEVGADLAQFGHRPTLSAGRPAAQGVFSPAGRSG
ncbi:hypothetical protein ABZ641_37420, partial [Kitasatospora sp. NPDC007106]